MSVFPSSENSYPIATQPVASGIREQIPSTTAIPSNRRPSALSRRVSNSSQMANGISNGTHSLANVKTGSESERIIGLFKELISIVNKSRWELISDFNEVPSNQQKSV